MMSLITLFSVEDTDSLLLKKFKEKWSYDKQNLILISISNQI